MTKKTTGGVSFFGTNDNKEQSTSKGQSYIDYFSSINPFAAKPPVTGEVAVKPPVAGQVAAQGTDPNADKSSNMLGGKRKTKKAKKSKKVKKSKKSKTRRSKK
jgi:hypothetical protein